MLKLLSSNPLNVELNPICHLLALLGAHHIFHVGRIRVNPLNISKYIIYLSRTKNKYITVSDL